MDEIVDWGMLNESDGAQYETRDWILTSYTALDFILPLQ